MSALSAGVILCITSCAQSYSVGFLYVTGTVTSGSSGNGYVAGFKIDHNTGKLTPINGLNPPVSSGGANPVRALLLGQSRFLYVLNQGVSDNPAGTSICTFTHPCKNSNITEFELGANGVLTPQQTFYSQGTNPFRMAADSSGNYLLVLDHDSPDNYSGATGLANGCAQALNGAQTCGDITVFAIDSTTGRLSLIQNKQVQVTTTASGTQNLTYFPVPSNPIDFAFTGSNVMTLIGTPATGDTIFPYGYTSTSGQLGITSNNLSDSIGSVYNATALVYAGGNLWVLDNDPLTVTLNGVSTTSYSQITPWTVASNGALSSTNSGSIADDANQSNPIYLVVENKGTRFYVANQGVPKTDSQLPLSGVAGWIINNSNLPTEISPQLSFGAGAGPVCMVEDPSNQFFYTANSEAQNVTGQVLDQLSGVLTPLNQSSKVPSDYALSGPPTWCLVDGRIGN
jgi:6-phosphogluconolactonase (cycloisomerase 2 family)